MKFIVGLTGGIGSGKSAVADLFAELGASVVDTDAIAHLLTREGGAAVPEVRRRFGASFIDSAGAMDRNRMRKLVFADPEAKQKLESLLHPMIREESRRLCEAAGGPYVILVIPLLVESSGYRDRVQRVLVVDCPRQVQVTRVMARSGLAENEVLAIIASQASREARLAAADDVIDNSGSLDSLRGQVLALHARYVAHAGAGANLR